MPTDDDANDPMSRALAEVLLQFGRIIVEKPEQLRAALSDTLGSQVADNRAGLDAVVNAAANGVAGQIRDSDPAEPATPEQIRAWFDQLVQNGLSLRNAALATHSWAAAFNASETAQLSSEISEDMLRDVPADPRRSGVVVTTEPSKTKPGPSGAPLDLGEEVTSTGGESILKQFGEVTIAAEALQKPAVKFDSSSEPEGGAVVRRDDGPTTSRSKPASPRWTRWIPFVAAAIAIVLAVAICAPIISTNNAKSEQTANALKAKPLPTVKTPSLFAQYDLDEFLLQPAELTAFLPGSTVADPPGPASDSSAGFGSVTVNPSTCSALLAEGPANDADGSPLAGSATETTGILVKVLARRYATVAEAQTQFAALTPGVPASCATWTAVLTSTTLPGSYKVLGTETLVGDSQQIRDEAVITAPGLSIYVERECVRNKNVVTCLVTRAESPTVTTTVKGADIWSFFSTKASGARPFVAS
jgi:hypothetical protein